MSDILENLAKIEQVLAARDARLARMWAEREDAAMMASAKHISKAQQKVALLRLEIGDMWPDPDVMDSYVFLVSEIGEVGDALLRSNYGHRGDYSRTRTMTDDIPHELGDVYLMLCTLATCLGVDLDGALQGCIDKVRSKHVPA